MPFVNGADEFQSENEWASGSEWDGKDRARKEHAREWMRGERRKQNAHTHRERGSNKIVVRLRHFHSAAHFQAHAFKFNLKFDLMWMWQHFDWFYVAFISFYFYWFVIVERLRVLVYILLPPPPSPRLPRCLSIKRREEKKHSNAQSRTDATRLKLCFKICAWTFVCVLLSLLHRNQRYGATQRALICLCIYSYTLIRYSPSILFPFESEKQKKTEKRRARTHTHTVT